MVVELWDLAAVAFVAVGAVLLARILLDPWYKLSEEQQVAPAVLRCARIYLNEAPIQCIKPLPFHGRVDQVFLIQDGQLLPVDTKRRISGKLREKDALQLSVYGYILRHTQSRPVTPYGYIRLKSPRSRRPRYVRVDLYPDAVVEAAWERYHGICRKQIKLDQLRIRPHECPSCEYRRDCRSAR